jgi:putative ATP-binding cassette transporter
MSSAAPAQGRSAFQTLVVPFWTSDQRWKALAQLIATLAVIFGGIYLQLWGNRLLGDVTDALVGRRWSLLEPALLFSVGVGVASGMATLARQALQGMLELSWRTWLTARFLNDWTESHVFYEIEREGVLSNADQRIAEDVRQFVTSTLNLTLNAVGVTVSAVTFTTLLWELSGPLEFRLGALHIYIPGYMVYLSFCYTVGSFVLAHWAGKALIDLNMNRHTVEADFRHGAMQLRENAEQIAFYGGGARESQRLMQRFEHIRGNVIAILIRSVKLGLTTNTYGHVFAPLPTLAALPRYLAGEITIGGITRVTGAFAALNANLAFFTASYGEFTDWLAVAHRLRDLSWSIEKAQNRVSGFTVERVAQPFVSTEALQLHKPGGGVLTDVPALHFAPGERWLVRGPSGTGKSTLLRALSGLWPHGSGRINLPADARLMFLPQRSYIPNGNFKAAMCYPGDAAAFDDALCRQVLIQCGLPQYTESLAQSDNWQQKLSGGEQQRLAFARVLLHRPDFIFLDEATSALDGATESMLYLALIEQLPDSAVISIAHRTSLAQYHDHELNLVPSGASAATSDDDGDKEKLSA